MSHSEIDDRDSSGELRKSIIFNLNKAGIDGDDISPDTLLEKPLKELRDQDYAAASMFDPKMRKVQVRKRCGIIKPYAIKHANGKCECCCLSAPFLTKHGHPYLEVNHIKKLSDYGLDNPANVATLVIQSKERRI